MWHLVCGDAAVEGVTFVLGQTVVADALRVLRDDLAVGALSNSRPAYRIFGRENR